MKIELPLTVRDMTFDDELSPGSGTLWQLEERIVARGMSRAELGVEHDNPRAKALYERLGYTAFTRRAEAWDTEVPNARDLPL